MAHMMPEETDIPAKIAYNLGKTQGENPEILELTWDLKWS